MDDDGTDIRYACEFLAVEPSGQGALESLARTAGAVADSPDVKYVTVQEHNTLVGSLETLYGTDLCVLRLEGDEVFARAADVRRHAAGVALQPPRYYESKSR